MSLVYMHQVNLAKCLFARFAPEAKLALVNQEDLNIAHTPWHKLPRKTLVFAVADLTHEAIVQDIFVIGRKPYILLLSLDLSQDQERIRRLESD